MKTALLTLALVLSIYRSQSGFAQNSTFTYQGVLREGTSLASGEYEVTFTLYDAVTNGLALGSKTVAPLPVTNGLLLATLNFDTNVFSGAPRWLEITVSVYGSDMPPRTLTPRQLITAVPYALHALSAANLVPPRDTPLTFTINGTTAWRIEPTAGAPNIIGGYAANAVSNGVQGAFIGGGGLNDGSDGTYPNLLYGNHSAIVGGFGNKIYDETAFIGGGVSHRIEQGAYSSVIVGGHLNQVGLNSYEVFVGGGRYNVIQPNSPWAVLAGGYANMLGSNSTQATIGGGVENTILFGRESTIAGGTQNRISGFEALESFHSTVGGGSDNIIRAPRATIAGGVNNTTESIASSIAGGGDNFINSASPAGAINGGADNVLRDAGFGVIAGGEGNTNSGTYGAIGGGRFNTIHGGWHTVIAGGYGNSVSGESAAVGGGYYNTAGHEATTVGGGSQNTADADYATVGGGAGNRSTGDMAIVAGGQGNHSSGQVAAVGGGYANAAEGWWSTIPGGRENVASGTHSFAAGRGAAAVHDGAFVWADASHTNFSTAPFSSIRTNEFAVRASGGARFVTALGENASPASGVLLEPGAGAWSSLCDRNAKENFAPANTRELLDKVAVLPITTWNYRSQDKAIRHVGPMAQDFHASFGVGANERTITTIDADGVALAAIQGLNAKVDAENRELRAALQAREATIAELQNRLQAIEKTLQTIANKQ